MRVLVLSSVCGADWLYPVRAACRRSQPAAGCAGSARAMSAAAMHIALVGNPNCGKTALFNRLTGSRQKVANYPGVTVERKEGHFLSATGRHYRVLDLPGAYSLDAVSLEEVITRDVCREIGRAHV